MKSKEEHLIELTDKVKKIDKVKELLKNHHDFDAFGIAFFLSLCIENAEINSLGVELRKILMTSPAADPLEGWDNNSVETNMSDKSKKLIETAVMVMEAILQADHEGRLKIIPTEEIDQYLSTDNSQLYYGFRQKLSSGDFNTDGYWPVADLSGKNLVSQAIIKPDPEQSLFNGTDKEALQIKMRNKVLDLAKRGDLAADIFDVITAKWIHEAKHHEAMISISADEILRARKIKDKEGGYTGRYTREQREEIQQQIDHLSYTWITVDEMEVVEEIKGKRKKTKWRGESKAISVTSRFGQVRVDGTTDAFAWRVRPGDIFARFLHGPGRQTALLSKKALQYDYYRHKWEKRIARYLAWIWRIDKNRTQEGVYVRTLLETVDISSKPKRPSETRERFEEALDRLLNDRVISGWEYESADETIFANKRTWWKNWIEWKVIITAPPEVLEHYKMLNK